MFKIDENKLEMFDILLVRFPDQRSRDIRAACNSEFSHAIIYLGNGSFIEGVEPVVTLFSYHRYYFSNLDDLRVLRLQSDKKSGLDSVATEKALRSLAYCNYSKRLLLFMRENMISPEIIKYFFENKIWQDGIVCTSLITLPYYAGGIDISKKNEPFYAHFGDIERFEGFEDVTHSVFKEIEANELNEETYDYYTTYKTGSLLEKQSEVVRELNSYVQGKYNDLQRNPDNYKDLAFTNETFIFSTWESIFPNIMKWFLTKSGQAIDNELSELIVKLEYHTLWFKEVHSRKEQFFPLYYHSFTNWSKVDMEFLKVTLQGALDRMEESEKAVFQNFTLCPSKTFHVLLDMYRSFSDQLRSSVNQYNALLKHLK